MPWRAGQPRRCCRSLSQILPVSALSAIRRVSAVGRYRRRGGPRRFAGSEITAVPAGLVRTGVSGFVVDTTRHGRSCAAKPLKFTAFCVICRIETPDFLAGVRVQRQHLAVRRAGIEHAVGFRAGCFRWSVPPGRSALGRSPVAIGQASYSLSTFCRGDLRQWRVAVAVLRCGRRPASRLRACAVRCWSCPRCRGPVRLRFRPGG